MVARQTIILRDVVALLFMPQHGARTFGIPGTFLMKL